MLLRCGCGICWCRRSVGRGYPWDLGFRIAIFVSAQATRCWTISFEVRLLWPLIVLILSSRFFGGTLDFSSLSQRETRKQSLLKNMLESSRTKGLCFCHFSCTELCVLPRIARCTAWRPVQPCKQRSIGWRQFHWLVEGAQNGLIKYKIYRAPLSFTLLFMKFWQGPVCVLIIPGRTSNSELLV